MQCHYISVKESTYLSREREREVLVFVGWNIILLHLYFSSKPVNPSVTHYVRLFPYTRQVINSYSINDISLSIKIKTILTYFHYHYMVSVFIKTRESFVLGIPDIQVHMANKDNYKRAHMWYDWSGNGGICVYACLILFKCSTPTQISAKVMLHSHHVS